MIAIEVAFYYQVYIDIDGILYLKLLWFQRSIFKFELVETERFIYWIS